MVKELFKLMHNCPSCPKKKMANSIHVTNTGINANKFVVVSTAKLICTLPLLFGLHFQTAP